MRKQLYLQTCIYVKELLSSVSHDNMLLENFLIACASSFYLCHTV